MAKKQRTQEDNERDRRISCYVAAAAMFVMAAIFFGGYIASGGFTDPAAIFFIPITALCIGFGVYQIKSGKKRDPYLPKIDENGEYIPPSSTALRPDNPELSKQTASQLVSSEKKWRKKMYEHGDIRQSTSNQVIFVLAVITAILSVFNIIIWFTGSYSLIMIVLNIILFIALILYAVLAKDEKKAYAAYANPIYGGTPLTAEQAEEEFKNGAFFSNLTSYICIGEKYVLCSAQEKYYAFDPAGIVWIFPRRTLTQNYYNGAYTGTTESYYMILCIDNGDVWQFSCEIGACNIISDLIAQKNPDVVRGWDEGLNAVYLADPSKFRFDFAQCVLPDPYSVQW